MNNRIRIALLVSSYLFILSGVFAQIAVKKATKLYAKMAYDKAIPKYLAVLKKDSMNVEFSSKLADCYRFTHNPEQAERWYSKSVKAGKAKPIDIFHYAQALMSNGKYAEARKWLETYKLVEPQDTRAESLIKSIDNINGYLEDSQNFKIDKLNINTLASDFGAVQFKDGIIFVTSRDRNQPLSRTNSATGEKFFALYFAKGKEDTFTDAKIFEKSIQTIYNDGPLCFNTAQDEMYVTTNNIEEGKTRKSKEGNINLKIYRYKFIENEWVFSNGFQANNDQYNVAHASLSADGNQLFFASDMPDGYGGMDIYSCTKKDNTWETPVNLGNKINTPSNELFPFIKSDGTLYFTSAGHEGLGGLDIYSSQEKNGIWGYAKNLMAPINSKNDDFALVFNPGNNDGYFSSNRTTSAYMKTSDDNMYHFSVLTPPLVDFTISLKDSVTDTDLTDAEISVTDAEGNVITQKSPKGLFTLKLVPNKTYRINTTVFAYINQQIDWSATRKEPLKVIKLQRSLGIDLEVQAKESFLYPYGIEGLKVTIVKANTNRTEEFISAQNGKVNAVLQPESMYYIIATGKGKTSNKYYVNTTGILEGNKLYKTIYLDNTIDPLSNKNWCLITGTLIDKSANTPLKDVKVTLYEPTTNAKKQEAISDAFGKYMFYNIELNQVYKVLATKEGYFTQSAEISTKSVKDCKGFSQNFQMDKIVLNKAIKIDNIYFDSGKWNIRPDAAKELNKLVKMLKDNPSIVIELSSHTDSQGSAESNLSLSDNRAKASAQYIIDNGIDSKRVSGKGYGETQPLNKCIDGVTCTETEYQVNRRTEFKVVGNLN
ncbi:MAG: OmpA family protein [Bacteroidetes bacterium]|nr:OmpA family protein [Bacteroidota bacterium]MBK9799252.1 OmpA family protein [Bacteroidota bacterium]